MMHTPEVFMLPGSRGELHVGARQPASVSGSFGRTSMHGQSALPEAAPMTRMTMSANAISGRGGRSMNVRAMPIRRNLVIGELLEQQSSCKFGALSYDFILRGDH